MVDANPSLELSIEGHTDNTGDAAHNRSLSADRARAVADALVALGVVPGRLQSQGFGQDRPVADNATEEGRARSEEHTSEIQSLMRKSYAVCCLQKNKTHHRN